MTSHTCARCSADANISIMSRFNTDRLCMDCATEEEGAPNFVKARDSEHDAVTHGDMRYPGIGLAPEDLAYLAKRRAERE